VSKNRIRELRQQNDMSAEQLARALDVPGQRLRRWDRGEVNPPSEVCRQIAERFGVTLDYVLGVADDEQRPRSGDKIPLYGKAAAGEGIVAVSEGAVDYVDRPSYLQNVEGCYALLVTGDSMEPRMFAGEMLIVHPYRPVRAGDYVVCQYRKDGAIEAVAKRYTGQDADAVHLHQHNPDNKIIVSKSDIVALHYIKAIRSI